MKIKHYFASLVILAIVSCASISYKDFVHQKIADFLKSHNEMTAIYKITSNSDLVSEGAQGYSNREEKKIIKLDDKMPIASSTKTMTAALILKMQEKAFLTIHDKLTKYFPDGDEMWGGKNAPGWAGEITIHHLLTHTSGLPDYVFAIKFDPSLGMNSAKKSVLSFAGQSVLTGEIGGQYNYSNTNYFILGIILEKVTCKDFGVLIKEEISDPLQLANTYIPSFEETVKFHEDKVEEASKRYFASVDKDTQKIQYSDAKSGVYLVAFADGGAVSTVDDLIKWNDALHGGKFLSEFSYKLMVTSYTEDKDPKGQTIQIGYGIKIIDLPEGNKLYFHPGSAIGIRCETGYVTYQNMSYAILSNVMYVRNANEEIDHTLTLDQQVGIEFFADEINKIVQESISKTLK
ncbi:MAG: class A beta-lactamase-related serine hydrolase [Alphaproteobacteria bacterium]|nr:class A beta-lactamase-related serine hydrolase [Alphaproteobacteria bacterium]